MMFLSSVCLQIINSRDCQFHFVLKAETKRQFTHLDKFYFSNKINIRSVTSRSDVLWLLQIQTHSRLDTSYRMYIAMLCCLAHREELPARLQ